MRLTILRAAAAVAVLGGTLMMPATASAERRLALVIALGEYSPPLTTLNTVTQTLPLKDALDNVANFDVSWVTDKNAANLQQLRESVRKFAEAIEPGDLVLVYYAGHAIQVKGRNYLLPGDYGSRPDPAAAAYPADELMKTIAAKEPKMKLLILDACRNNRLNREGTGLAAMEPSKLGPGTRIEFSANAGETASDEGTFATALIEELQKPGLSIDEVFMNVRQRVMSASGETQMPVSYNQMTFNFYFVPPDMDADKALTILARATESLPRGDIGQTRAVQSLIQHNRSLAGTDLQGLSFADAHFTRGDFARADLTGSELTRAALNHANLTRARLSFATLDAARLQDANLEGARLSFATAECVSVKEKRVCTDFSGANARDSVWLGVKAPGAQFSRAILTGARFMFADLRGARFDGANLSNAFFVGSDLRGATFAGATLDKTDLTGAILDDNPFPPALKKGTCEVALSPFGFSSTLSVVIVEDIPNSRFDGGYEHARFIDERYPFTFFGKGLPPCGKRELLADDWYPIWNANGQELVRTDVGMRFPHKFLQQAGRRAAVRQRIEQQLASFSARRR